MRTRARALAECKFLKHYYSARWTHLAVQAPIKVGARYTMKQQNKNYPPSKTRHKKAQHGRLTPAGSSFTWPRTTFEHRQHTTHGYGLGDMSLVLPTSSYGETRAAHCRGNPCPDTFCARQPENGDKQKNGIAPYSQARCGMVCLVFSWYFQSALCKTPE